jgi:hypothetical protein
MPQFSPALEERRMSGKPNWKQWIRGLIGASLLAVICVCASALTIVLKDAPVPIHSQWPHLDPLFAPLVMAPAAAFWWYYFTYHWRGVALVREVAAVTIKQPRFWFYLVLAFLLCCLLMMPAGVHSAAREFRKQMAIGIVCGRHAKILTISPEDQRPLRRASCQLAICFGGRPTN